jgi:gamma-glutamyl-gamma-aminobutyrate hydrolase PuuD
LREPIDPRRAVIRVALTQRTVTAATGEVRDCLDQRWVSLLEPAGALALPLPTLVADLDGHLAALAPDAVILTGGNDLASLPGAKDPTPERDDLERRVVAWCRENDVCLVGVCRGMQLLAQLHGIPLRRVDGHVARRHRVRIEGAPGNSDGIHEVNTFHSYVVAAADLPPSLRAFAWDDDGNVEGFEHREARQVGLMWHPEREPARDAWGARVLLDLLAETGRS